jgi:hypothetical protein
VFYDLRRDLAVGNDDQRRELTRMIAEQIRFELGPGWGTKKAGPANPPSKDSITFNDPATLWNWDWQNGATREPIPPGEMTDITGQVFIEVSPINHLGGDIPDEPDGPDPDGDVIPYDETKSIEFGLACNDVYIESGAPMDPGMISVHSSRAAWDYYVGGLEWEESKRKHVNEFRAVYGLSPI